MSNLPLDYREITVGEDDVLAFGVFGDAPGKVGLICEKVEDGKRVRRAIFFPDGALLAASLAQGLMELTGVQQISIRKKGGASIKVGPPPVRDQT